MPEYRAGSSVELSLCISSLAVQMFVYLDFSQAAATHCNPALPKEGWGLMYSMQRASGLCMAMAELTAKA